MMNNDIKIIKKVMKRFIDKYDKIFVNPKDIKRFQTILNDHFGDRRYTVQMLAGSDKSGIFRYRNKDYSYYIENKDNIDLEYRKRGVVV